MALLKPRLWIWIQVQAPFSRLKPLARRPMKSTGTVKTSAGFEGPPQQNHVEYLKLNNNDFVSPLEKDTNLKRVVYAKYEIGLESVKVISVVGQISEL